MKLLKRIGLVLGDAEEPSVAAQSFCCFYCIGAVKKQLMAQPE
jgi:hypothetical protein